MDKYNHKKIESKWVKDWKKHNLYSVNISKVSKKFYNLMMFPYPSAEGLHAGNMFAFTGSDIYGRFKRMQGYDVFEPIGLDGFGIHSENYAIKIGRSPQEHSEVSQKNFYRQLTEIGGAFDWKRKLETYDPEYYQWTQWLFVEMFKSGLAYRDMAKVNWCPNCKTVLADEQVLKSLDARGVCERCGTEVVKKDLKQWFFRITDYSERLLANLEKINWPAKLKVAQKNWIGKKKGIEIGYKVVGSQENIVCFTTRPETQYGATFIVLSPENPIIPRITIVQNKDSVSKYIEEYRKNSELKKEREIKEKTGVFTGSFALNPFTKEKMPIWVSDFVISDFGTGALVGVPGHDKRDFEFAKKFDLPVRIVIDKNGILKNSGRLNGLTISMAYRKILDIIKNKSLGNHKTIYHLRDWLVSRQRYWGPPIPMIYCQNCASDKKSWFTTKEGIKKKILFTDRQKLIQKMSGWYPEQKLPLKLPVINDYLPKGEGRGPLADHPEFYKVPCPFCGNEAKRETDVSDTFLDSSWYFLAYPNVGTESYKKGPSEANFFLDKKILNSWLPIDLYFGGAEHAVLHLMYARFICHFLFDLGYIEFEEPFPRFYAHGLVIKDGAKMSKSKGNVVNPDQYIEKYGADTLRMYLMFMGPMDGYPDFRDSGIEGMNKFIKKVYTTCVYQNIKPNITKEQKASLINKMHQTIKKCTEDIKEFKYNTAISVIMEYINEIRQATKVSTKSTKKDKLHEELMIVLVKLIAPFAPHIAEELWQEKLKQSGSVHHSLWPTYNKEFVKELSLTVVIQVNGKLRDTIILSRKNAIDKNKVLEIANKSEKVSRHLIGKKVKRTLFVPGKILNFVV